MSQLNFLNKGYQMRFLKLSVMCVLAFVLAACGEQGGNYAKLDLKAKDLPGVELNNVSGAEGFGRWTDGNPATFKFTAGLPKDFRLIIGVTGAFGENAGKPVEVTVGDKKQSFVAPAEPQVIQLDFTDVAKGSNTVSLSMPSQKSPKDLGMSGDERKLGLSLSSLEIAALPKAK